MNSIDKIWKSLIFFILLLISAILLLIIIIEIKNLFIFNKKEKNISFPSSKKTGERTTPQPEVKKLKESLEFSETGKEDKFLYFFLTGSEYGLNSEKYAEEFLLRNSIECINFFKKLNSFNDNLKKKTFFFFTNQSNPLDRNNENLQLKFKNALIDLKNGNLERVDYVHLSSFHWTSGYNTFIDNQYIFNNYNSIGNSIPIKNREEQIKEFMKNIEKNTDLKIDQQFENKLSSIIIEDSEEIFKDANEEQINQDENDDGNIKNPQFDFIKPKNTEQQNGILLDFAAQQEDGNFCGYCSIYNLEKEFFKEINVFYDENYEVFKTQMYYSLFFLNNFYILDDSMNKKIFDQDIFLLNYNFEQIKQIVSDSKDDNSIISLNTYSRYMEFIENQNNTNIYSFIQYLRFIVGQDKNDHGKKIINNLEQEIQRKIEEIVIQDQEIKKKAKEIFDFMADHNKKIADKIQFDPVEQLQKFATLRYKYKQIKYNSIIKFFNEIIGIFQGKKIVTKQKFYQIALKNLKEQNFMQNENLYNKEVYEDQENEINIAEHIAILFDNFANKNKDLADDLKSNLNLLAVKEESDITQHH